ncbi:glycoside hydrolase family protein [Dysgonomonas termitidis]|uniref:Glycosyl hydrolase family 32 N-terminal domain-containing protein n=1 Tax=Dysgonomonas termitidis TaxID=1516126 RepID=A0ABV9KU62_9BACT
MGKKLTLNVVLVFTVISITASCCIGGKTPVKVNLLSNSWTFESTQPASGTLSMQSAEAELSLPADTMKGFTIKFKVDLKKIEGEKEILNIPEMIRVCLRQHDVQDRKRQNYPAYKMADGSVPVLEAILKLQLPTANNPIEDMTIGIPLAMLDNPEGEHDIVLNFTDAHFTMYVDGKALDNDYPLGYPVVRGKSNWKINTEYVKNAEFFYPYIPAKRVESKNAETATNIQYWTPEGHNNWVGDVATLYHNGRYHIFYLYDRREHGSKFGRGGHYFEHISTADFKTWTEHEAAAPIEEQWETLGTGTPFVFNGKLCISYGLHTTRIYPSEKTTLPMLWDELNKNGKTGSHDYKTIAGIPAGSTYSISEDGVTNFKKTHILFHPCENPSVYTNPEGTLRMIANYGSKGTWESENIDGGWHCIDPDFPRGGDCTFYFRWNKFDYILGGFNWMWSKPATDPENSYVDIVQQGVDYYNGLSVPAVSEIKDGRFLMAGWVKMRNWGGSLNIYELIQLPDGRIGSKWMDEIVPATTKSKNLDNNDKIVQPTGEKPFMLTFDVHPSDIKNGKMSVLLLPENGDKGACEFQIRLDGMYAQYANGSLSNYSGKEKSLREGGAPHGAHNYAIEKLIDTDKPFTVRMVVKNSNKFGGALIDTEIAGKRTMISYRPDLTVSNLRFRTEGADVKNIKIAELIE